MIPVIFNITNKNTPFMLVVILYRSFGLTKTVFFTSL